VGNTPEQFQALIHSESARWQKLIKDLNITLD
jgi:tripartite-type tricarboxylate transporter receptor subunit TctC